MTKVKSLGFVLTLLLGFTMFYCCAGNGRDSSTSKAITGTGDDPIGGNESDDMREPEIQWEEKIYWTGTIDEDFDGDGVLIIMDKNIGGVNKVHDKSFFGDIEIEYIKDLTRLTGDINSKGINWDIWRQILWIKLPGNSKENVVKVIRQLEKIDGIIAAGPNHIEDIIAAEPSYIQEPVFESTEKGIKK